jgi:hypothetical protein
MVKLAHQCKEFEAGANLINQSYSIFLWLCNAETGFIESNGWCPFKFENKYLRLNSLEKAIYWYHFWPIVVFDGPYLRMN